MKSLQDSAKNALYERLLNSINEEYGNLTLPEHERRFLGWDEHDGKAEAEVKAREQALMKRYGTLEGFEPIILGWGQRPSED